VLRHGKSEEVSLSSTLFAAPAHKGPVFVWDVTSRTILHRLDGANPVCFSPDGSRIASGTVGLSDGTISIWNTSSGELEHSFGGCGSPADVVAWHPGDRFVVTIHDDRAARLWNPRTGHLVATLVNYHDGEWLAFSPSLYYVSSAGAEQRANISWGVSSYPLCLFATTLRKPDAVRASIDGTPLPKALVSLPPQVRVTSHPGRVCTVDTRRVRLRAEASDGLIPLDRLEVSQDGIQIAAADLARSCVLDPGRRSLRFEHEFDVPASASTTIVTLQAVNSRGTRSSIRSVELRYSPPSRDLYVLTLAVRDFEDDSMNLQYPIKDAEDLSGRLGAEASALYDEVHVRSLRDDEVTTRAIRRLRTEYLLQAQPEDTILVFVAGHGVRTEQGEYFFLTPECTPDDPYAGIDRDDIEDLVRWEKLHAQRRVLLMDTCHAGSDISEATRAADRGIVAFDQDDVDQAVDLTASGIYIIAASSDEGFAREREGNGLFTKAILEGLTAAGDRNGNGYIEIEELKEFASEMVHRESGGRQRPTIPTIRGGENFPLARVPERD